LPGWTCRIRPFHDRPDVEVPWIFYRTAPSAPDGPPTVFTDRFWDDRERFIPPGVGVVPGSLKPYWGPLPPTTVRPLVGSPVEWVEGLSYERWIANGYVDPIGCWPVVQPNTIARIRQAQSIGPPIGPKDFVYQVQAVQSGPTSMGAIEQAQNVPATWEVGAASTCCEGALPLSLTATIAGSDSGDGVYPLTFDPTTLAPSWKWDGAMGTCSTHLQAIVMFCPSPGSTMFMAVRRATPSQTPILCTLVSFSCDPVDGLWNLPAGSCPSDSGAGTITVAE